MKTPLSKSSEKERRRKLQELVAETGRHALDDFAPGTFGCHELLDRLAVLGDTLEEAVLDHPSCVQNPGWYALANQSVKALRDLYQRVGAEHLENGEALPTPPDKIRRKRTG